MKGISDEPYGLLISSLSGEMHFTPSGKLIPSPIVYIHALIDPTRTRILRWSMRLEQPVNAPGS
jgi:hypothetical protein